MCKIIRIKYVAEIHVSQSEKNPGILTKRISKFTIKSSAKNIITKLNEVSGIEFLSVFHSFIQIFVVMS